jgi:hypothetical protein
MKATLFDVVRLLEDVPPAGGLAPEGLSRGDHGTIVEVYTEPVECYEVEVVLDDGSTKGMATLLPEQFEVVTHHHPVETTPVGAGRK